jgi:hypothetical protein
MEDEALFEMLEMAVAKAAEMIVSTQVLVPFACALKKDAEIQTLTSALDDHNKAYEALWVQLKDNALHYKGIVLIQDVINPENFNMEAKKSIRVHVENASSKDAKIAACYLYIPYTLHKDEQKQINISLHKPKPVGFSHEIFV